MSSVSSQYYFVMRNGWFPPSEGNSIGVQIHLCCLRGSFTMHLQYPRIKRSRRIKYVRSTKHLAVQYGKTSDMELQVMEKYIQRLQIGTQIKKN